MHFTTHILPNGLPALFVDTQAFPSITTMILVGAGSRYETPENNGIAHFFEHMAFKGSAKYPTAFDISSTIEGMGGVFNAFTSKDHTGYYVKAPGSHFEEVARVLSDMILHSTIDPEEIEREKNVIVEEINMYEDMPARRVSDYFDELIFKGHPLACDVAGSEKTVRASTRKTFTQYIDQLYHPDNAVVVVAGGLSFGSKPSEGISKYTRIIEETFGGWGGISQKPSRHFTHTQKTPLVSVHHKQTEQAHFCLGYRTFGLQDPRRYALTLLSTILGGGMSSRLFIEVRERRGLCYYVSTGRELYTDTGYLVTQAGVTNNISQLNEAIKVIIGEHEKITAGSITEEELSKAKEQVKGRMLLSLEDSYHVASLEGTKYLFEHKTVTPEELITRIEQVTKDEVCSLAKEIIQPKGLSVTVVGPYTKKDIQPLS